MTLRMCYLAYPIDQAPVMASQMDVFEWLNKAKQALLDQGVEIVYDPGDAFSIGPDVAPGDEIDWVNRRAHNLAGGVLAVLPKGWASIGVPIEIDRALAQGKWVALCSDTNSWMLNERRKGMARFGISDADLLAAAEWLATREGEPYPMPGPATLPVRRLAEHAVLPQRGYHDDAGIDLVVAERTVVPPASWRDVPNGVAVELPHYGFGLIVGRSSTRRNKGLFVHTGVIDPGWRGELFAMAENTTDEEIVVEKGERIAQLIVLRAETPRLMITEQQELTPHPRGENGFGSTGV